MQNPLISLLHIDLRASLQGVIRRFPLPVLLVCITAGLWFYTLNSESTDEWLYRSMVTTIAVFLFSTGLSLFTENRDPGRYTAWIKNIIPILFGIVFYWSLFSVYDASIESITYIGLTLSGFVAFVFVAPFLRYYIGKQGENTTHFYNYFVFIAWTLLMSGIVGLALLALGSTAITSVVALFDVEDWIGKVHLFANWGTFSLVFIAPIYGLIHLPEREEYTKSEYEENRFFSFMVRFITTPFIYIYFIILYAYSVKVLSNFSEWPNGKVSWMVIGFSSFGYLIYIFSKAYETKSAMIRIFRRYFAWVVLPQVAMLFYAIYLRIHQYDLTMNRYFVVAFGIWLTIISLYYIISGIKRLSIIPATLLAIMFVISIGPWSVYRIPLMRQYDRLIMNLEQANILKGEKIIPLTSPKDISKELSNNIYSGISYICEFNNCSMIKDLFSEELREAIKKDEADWKSYQTIQRPYRGISNWLVIKTVTEKIKVQSSYGYSDSNLVTVPQYIEYNTDPQTSAPYPISIDPGYSKIVKIYNERDIKSGSSNPPYPYLTLDPSTSTLRYYYAINSTRALPLVPPVLLVSDNIPTVLDQKDLTFVVSGSGIEAKLLFQNYTIKNPKYTGTETTEYYMVNGVALIRETR